MSSILVKLDVVRYDVLLVVLSHDGFIQPVLTMVRRLIRIPTHPHPSPVYPDAAIERTSTF